MCMHVYKPPARPGASRSLLFDIEVVTLLLGEYAQFASANLLLPHHQATLVFFIFMLFTYYYVS